MDHFEAAGLPSTCEFSLPSDDNYEIVVAWVAAMGTNLEHADDILTRLLRSYSYDCDVIRVSDLLRLDPRYVNDRSKGIDTFYNTAIERGNNIRAELQTNDALAQFAMRRIAELRKSAPLNGNRRAYIIHQLKLPEEIETFRKVYGNLFYCVAIYSHKSLRTQRMREKGQDLGIDDEKINEQAERLVKKDEHEDRVFGQNVRDAFAEADYYIRSDDEGELESQLDRFVRLVFGRPIVSPTSAELAMAHAKVAALRSADLSRQIGAVIVSRDGRILTTGCNEVPKAGGGQYWAGDVEDARDFQRKKDINDYKKRQAIIELAEGLNDVLLIEWQGNPTGLYNKFLKDRLRGTLVDSLLEFSRAIHAEVAAIDAAAIETLSVRDADLYCTTFPCHLCARQIVNAGIRNVFYIEPYPKSLTSELHDDSVEIDPQLDSVRYKARLTGQREPGWKVAFIPFSGVAPRRFGELFLARHKRKTPDGALVAYNPDSAKPKNPPLRPDYTRYEESITKKLNEVIKGWEAAAKGRKG